MAQRKIVLVGGGSYGWAPRLVGDILRTESIQDSEIVLYDIDKKATNLVKTCIEKITRDERFGQLACKPKIVSTDNGPLAFKNADYVIITINTGGLNSVGYDLELPKEYGIYHTVGDTCGPAGWARTIRNFGVFEGLANTINRYAPGAMVLNYSNPMTSLTDILLRRCEGPVIGLCHGMFENRQFIKDFYKLENNDKISMKYAGLNHFIWISEAYAGKIDVIADLRKKLKKHSFNDLLDGIGHVGDGLKPTYPIATELFRLTGIMPYLNDRHVCEFFHCYVTSKKNMKKYGVQKWYNHISIEAYKKRNIENSRKFVKMVSGRIDDMYFQSTGETAANIIEAHSHSKVVIDVGNVSNTGQISNIAKGAVVETAVKVDRSGFTPIHFGPLPEPVLGLIEPWSKSFTMTIDACFQKNKMIALQALRLDPLCSHLTADQVMELGNRLLGAHKRFIKVF